MHLIARARRAFGASDGRIRVGTLIGASGVVVAAFLLGVVPALAGNGAPSGLGVQPVEVTYGGGSGACAANIPGRLPSAATYELHINNPVNGIYTGPDPAGTQVEIFDIVGDQTFSFRFVGPTSMAAFDVVVNGGSQNTHYDYDGNGGPGPVQTDTLLHAPTKGGSSNLFNLSHINLCYDINPVADLSVTKTPVGGAVADVGDQVTFAIVVGNAAESTVNATGVTVTDTLPSGMTFVSASAGGTHDNGTVTWSIASIAPGESVTLDLVVEITSAGAGQDLVNTVSVTGNETDPTPGNDNANSVPPVTVTATLTGTKYHDRDTDGTLDLTEEDVLQGWTIAAFDADGFVTEATTDSNGSYSLTLEPGDYIICEEDTDAGLEPPGFGYEWAWTQSTLSADTWGADCSGNTDYLDVGHAVTVAGDVTDIDFANHRQLSVTCDPDDDVVVSLGDPVDGSTDDDPLATVTFPAGCTSVNYTTSYEVGRSNPELGDPDSYRQFFVFGGDPTSTTVLGLTVEWDAEDAFYDGTDLVVATTLVQLVPGGAIAPATFCSSLTGGLPNATTPYCIDSRTILEGNPLDAGLIRITENGLALGDPNGFR